MKLYGTSRSRAARCLVAAEELGLAYEHVPLFAEGRDRDADRRLMGELNPNAHIPVLEHDGGLMWESMAINLFLGEIAGGPLWPASAADRGATYQWSIWAQTEIDRADWNRARRSGDEAQIAADREGLVRALGVLDRALAERDFILGEAFSLVDANVACTLSQPNERGLIGWQRLDPAEAGLTALAGWLSRCRARPSYQRVADLP
ncbi:MAG TPA: glutathione S-transferase family protein [Phenylobacterium sp.]